MRTLPVFALAIGFLTCATTGAHAQKLFTYRCEDGTTLTATYLRFIQLSVARLAIDGKTIVLPQRRSADGGRYARGGIQFWIKGRSATLTRQGKTANCETN